MLHLFCYDHLACLNLDIFARTEEIKSQTILEEAWQTSLRVEIWRWTFPRAEIGLMLIEDLISLEHDCRYCYF